MSFFGLVIVVLITALITSNVLGAVRAKRGGYGDASKSVRSLGINLGAIAAVLIIFRLAAPWGSSQMLYEGIFSHAGIALSVSVATILALASYSNVKGMNEALGIVYGVLAVIAAGSGIFLSSSFNKAAIASEYKFSEIKSLIADDPARLRFTPQDVAYNTLFKRATASGFSIDADDIDAVDIDGGFGYVVPITPDGVVGHFARQNPGFMVLNDWGAMEDSTRARKVNQPQLFGEGMLLFDNLNRKLHEVDWSAVYPEIYYLQLDSADVNTFTAVAPKFEYHYRFPLASVPEWAGVVLVHSDGKTEELSVEEVRKDPRLRGRQNTAAWYLRTIVEAQNYDEGFISGWYNRPGQIKIPDLPGESQMPFYFRGADGHDYYVVATEPKGTGSGLFRMYYLNASTGERFVYEFPPDAGLVGPEGVLDNARIAGHQWLVEGSSGSSGNEQLLEPVYLVRNGKLYWKFSATPLGKSIVSSTIVVDPKTSHPVQWNGRQEFLNRADFMAWLRGGESTAKSASTPEALPVGTIEERINRIENLLQNALQELTELKKK